MAVNSFGRAAWLRGSMRGSALAWALATSATIAACGARGTADEADASIATSTDASFDTVTTVSALAPNVDPTALRLVRVGDVASGKSPWGGLSFNLRASGIELLPAGDASIATNVALSRVGRPTALTPNVASALRVAESSAEIVRSGGVHESWLNAASGLEQRFAIDAAPTGDGKLVLELAITGALTPFAAIDRSEIALRDGRGSDRIKISGLLATDARGAVLPSEFDLVDGRVQIVVDDRGAIYPIAIDPTYSVSSFGATDSLPSAAALAQSISVAPTSSELIASLSGYPATATSGGAAAVIFSGGAGSWTEQAALSDSLLDATEIAGGVRVAIDGTTAVIGVPGSSHTVGGAVYVFVEASGVWSETQVLADPGGAASDDFGSSIAIRGNTLIVGAPNGNGGLGRVYAFERTSATAAFPATGYSINGSTSDTGFGQAVAFDGKTIAAIGVHSGGTAYLFTRVGAGSYPLATSFGPPSATFAAKTPTIVIHDDRFVWGASVCETAAAWRRNGSIWQARQEFGDTGASCSTGHNSLAYDGTTLVMAFQPVGGGPAVHVFSELGGKFTELTDPTTPTSASTNGYGASVGVSGSDILIGDTLAGTSGLIFDALVTITPAASCGTSGACTAAHPYCVDGECCNAVCDGACEACNITGSIGTCSASITNVDPSYRGTCTGSVGLCAGTCDGSSTNCTDFSSTASCGPAVCSGNSIVNPGSCDGGGQCNQSTTSCGAYACSDAACLTACTNGADCAGGDICNLTTGKCGATNGHACTASSDCSTGFCVDGVCCDTACSGQCEACDVGVSTGKCTPIAGTPVSPRAACGSDGTLCKGTCNGTLTTACTYPSTTTSCRAASCASDTETLGATCDGKGDCPTVTTQDCGLYICGATACKTSCTADSDCAIAGDFCNASHQCAPRGANGTSCATGDGCTSGICADTVCCATACGDLCDSCNLPGSAGTCTPNAAGSAATHGSCTSDGTSCGGACDGSSKTSCAYPNASTSCRAASCTNGVQTLAASCNGSGDCPTVVTQSCNGYACNGLACLTSCGGDGDCASGDFCNTATNQCVAKAGAGAACTATDQCSSGFCADGVCCNSACGDVCDACNLPSAKGTCTPVSGSPATGHGSCNNAGTTCGGSCDGTHATTCNYPTTATSCRAASCTGGIETIGASCDGAGNCPTLSQQSCGTYVCDTSACKSSCGSNTDCVAGSYCSGGVCVGKVGLGVSCSTSQQCTSGFCADGVCCNQACDGQCQGCALSGTAGTCTTVTGAPPSGHAACGSDGSLCGGRCDGTNTATCTYPTGATACRSAACTNGFASSGATCDGLGDCPSASTTQCAPYACSGTTCGNTCASNGDCETGAVCVSGACVAPLDPGAACSNATQCSSGFCTDGVCCNQACGGQCQACDVPGLVGTCDTVSSGAPHGSRAACANDGTGCGGTCDGTSPLSCDYPTSITSCGAPSCQGGNAISASSCNGFGACGTSVSTTVCAPFACNAGVCGTGCAVDTDCAAGLSCISGACVVAPVDAGSDAAADAAGDSAIDGSSSDGSTGTDAGVGDTGLDDSGDATSTSDAIVDDGAADAASDVAVTDSIAADATDDGASDSGLAETSDGAVDETGDAIVDDGALGDSIVADDGGLADSSTDAVSADGAPSDGNVDGAPNDGATTVADASSDAISDTDDAAFGLGINSVSAGGCSCEIDAIDHGDSNSTREAGLGAAMAIAGLVVARRRRR